MDKPTGDRQIETSLLMSMAASLMSHPPKALTIVQVRDEAGTVTLSGEVGSLELRSQLEEIAAHYPGVWETVNRLTIRSLPGAELGDGVDTTIQEEIK